MGGTETGGWMREGTDDLIFVGDASRGTWIDDAVSARAQASAGGVYE